MNVPPKMVFSGKKLAGYIYFDYLCRKKRILYMLEHIAEFTTWPILTGIIVGYIANRIMSGEGKGCCMNLIIGIVGSYVGAFIGSLFNVQLLGAGYVKNFIFCVIGSVVVLWLWKKLFD